MSAVALTRAIGRPSIGRRSDWPTSLRTCYDGAGRFTTLGPGSRTAVIRRGAWRRGPASRTPRMEVSVVRVKTILVPTDFSDTANAAVRCAAGLAETFGSSLTLLNVVEDAVVMGLTADVGAPVSRRLIDDALSEAAAKLDRALADTLLNRPGVERAVVAGDPYESILRYASERQVDLIVMGTHGRTGFAHLLLGSVAERVVRTSPCPVLTVRTCQHGFDMA